MNYEEIREYEDGEGRVGITEETLLEVMRYCRDKTGEIAGRDYINEGEGD